MISIHSTVQTIFHELPTFKVLGTINGKPINHSPFPPDVDISALGLDDPPTPASHIAPKAPTPNEARDKPAPKKHVRKAQPKQPDNHTVRQSLAPPCSDEQKAQNDKHIRKLMELPRDLFTSSLKEERPTTARRTSKL